MTVPRIIVLDGPDACGKTTLAESFHDVAKAINLPYQYIHATHRFKNKMPVYHEALLRKALNFNGLTVIDRHFWSEVVYSMVYRDGTKWPMMSRYFDRVFLKHCVQTVICSSSPEQVAAWHRREFAERKEMYKPDERIYKLAELYNGLYEVNSSRDDYHYYDRNKHGKISFKFAQRVIENQVAMIDRQLPQAIDPTEFKCAGNFSTAKWLFVINSASFQKPRKDIWPMWRMTPTSDRIVTTLRGIGVGEDEICYVECDYGDMSLYHSIINHYPNLRVVWVSNVWQYYQDHNMRDRKQYLQIRHNPGSYTLHMLEVLDAAKIRAV